MDHEIQKESTKTQMSIHDKMMNTLFEQQTPRIQSDTGKPLKINRGNALSRLDTYLEEFDTRQPPRAPSPGQGSPRHSSRLICREEAEICLEVNQYLNRHQYLNKIKIGHPPTWWASDSIYVFVRLHFLTLIGILRKSASKHSEVSSIIEQIILDIEKNEKVGDKIGTVLTGIG
ncbi:hypothetical protein Ddc_11396 [Ditylenchus destructor]|nr:hypothetical protein Ddc_11396 [Ditylenchus destructor]